MLTVREYLREANPRAKLFDGLDAAILGVGCQYTKTPLVVYSASKIIKCYMKQGMTYDAAMKYYGRNCECLWIGEHTPIIVDDITIDVRSRDDEHKPTDVIRRKRDLSQNSNQGRHGDASRKGVSRLQSRLRRFHRRHK